jgi:hypothetical protein
MDFYHCQILLGDARKSVMQPLCRPPNLVGRTLKAFVVPNENKLPSTQDMPLSAATAAGDDYRRSFLAIARKQVFVKCTMLLAGKSECNLNHCFSTSFRSHSST